MEYNLERFLGAQNYAYAAALDEMKQGRKQSHWIWYIFPQLCGLGRSEMAARYGIAGAGEAKAYMQNEILRERLLEITNVVLELKSDSDINWIMGSHIDAVKLKSCMTLFAETAPEYEVFQKVLDKYYGGKKDKVTLRLLGKEKEFKHESENRRHG